MKSTRALQVKVGMIVLIAVAILGVTIFLMGKERRLFESKVPFEIHFTRAGGLREGAPVSLAGVTVGSVEAVSFPTDIRENFIVVRINVVGKMAPRMRKDMVAKIRTQGLLGDRFIELSGGNAASDLLRPGGVIASVNPVDYEALLSGGGDLVQNLTEVTGSLKNVLKSLEQGKGFLGQIVASDNEGGKWAETADNLRSASASLKSILGSIEKGNGFLGQLIENRPAGQVMAGDLKVGLSELRKSAESLRKTTEKIEKGEGSLGTLIQDPNAGREILTSLRRSASNLESITLQFREGEGVLQRLASDKPYADRVLGNLEQTTKDLAQITGKIEKGEGTIGALVNDPELYRDAKGVVGSLKGSWLLSVYRFFHKFTGGERTPETELPKAATPQDESGS